LSNLLERGEKRFGLDVFKRVLGQPLAGKKRMPTVAYCVKCKAKQEMKDPKSITMKNGRKATQGTCPKCGTKMFKIGG
jgi:hypothetical protein